MSDLMELVTSSPIDKELYSFRDEQAILELRALGFDAATKESHADLMRRQKHARITAYNYPVVTDDAIRNFLKRKVEIYNAEHMPKKNARKKSKIDSLIAACHINGNLVGKCDLREAHVEYVFQSYDSQNQSHLAIVNSAMQSIKKIVTSISIKTKDFLKPAGIGQFIYEEVRVQGYPGIPPRDVLEKFKEHKARNLFDYFTIGYVKDVPDPILFGRIEEDNERRWFIAQWGSDVCLDDLI